MMDPGNIEKRAAPLQHLSVMNSAIRIVSDQIMMERSTSNSPTQIVDIDDQLGWTLRCLRGWEQGNNWLVHRCLRAYLNLYSIVSVGAIGSSRSKSLLQLRDHAADLARAATPRDLRRIQEDEGTEDENVMKTRRGRAQVRLRRLKPGCCNVLAALQTARGDVISDADAVAAELRLYWQDIFCSRPCDRGILGRWISEELTDGAPWSDDDEDAWRITRKSIEKVVRRVSRSSLGPDGIPYNAWKRLGKAGTAILFEAAELLGKESIDGIDDHSFNIGDLVFLPRQIAGVDPLLGDYYTAADVRPLMVVNTDNRLIANGVRLLWEPICEKWVSAAQQRSLRTAVWQPTSLTYNLRLNGLRWSAAEWELSCSTSRLLSQVIRKFCCMLCWRHWEYPVLHARLSAMYTASTSAISVSKAGYIHGSRSGLVSDKVAQPARYYLLS